MYLELVDPQEIPVSVFEVTIPISWAASKLLVVFHLAPEVPAGRFQCQMICPGDTAFAVAVGAGVAHGENVRQAPFENMLIAPLVPQLVQNTINPSAGAGMAFRCSKVIRGMRKPLSLNFTSSPAEASGWVLSVLMLT